MVESVGVAASGAMGVGIGPVVVPVCMVGAAGGVDPTPTTGCVC